MVCLRSSEKNRKFALSFSFFFHKKRSLITGASLGKMEVDKQPKKKHYQDKDIHVGQTEFVLYSNGKHTPRAIYIEEPIRNRSRSHSSLFSNLQKDNFRL